MTNKFIQISVPALPAKAFNFVNKVVFALTETGEVWAYDFNEQRWKQLSEDRKGDFLDESYRD